MTKLKNAICNISKNIVLFLIGGGLYFFIEILWRGYSHWTMFILGGICFIILGLVNELYPWSMGLVWQSLIGAWGITLLEFATGCIVNLTLHWAVWNYSNVWGNLLGQICVPYSLLWIPLSAIGIILDDALRHCLFNEPVEKYKLF